MNIGQQEVHKNDRKYKSLSVNPLQRPACDMASEDRITRCIFYDPAVQLVLTTISFNYGWIPPLVS